MPDENIGLLLNDKAKNAQIVAELDGLAEGAQEGDLVIIYFSGHGDVETKTRNQFGFLLAWDSPPTNYKAGAYPLIFLQDIVSTISDKKARVVVIADACHAGKLAGSGIGGTQATAQALAQQFANEVKIMSCQPNELALEGEQWGRGRGAFSFNLLEGLSGLADKNADATVNLYELDRYLGDLVPAQTAPHSPIPMVAGDKQFLLSRVDAPSLSALKGLKTEKSGGIAVTSGKGFAEGLLAAADSGLLRLYHDFETALEKGDLLTGSPSADELYVLLSKEEKLRPLHGLMRRNLTAALQNEPQQALNALLESDPYEVNKWAFSPQGYDTYPKQLARAIELLGEGHYMRPSLESKKRYFEAYLMTRDFEQMQEESRRDSIRAEAKRLLLTAIELDPEAAYLYFAAGLLHFFNDSYRTDSVVYYFEKALERSPGWVLPYLYGAQEWLMTQSNMNEGERWLEKALEIKPESYVVLQNLCQMRIIQNRPGEALAICRKMIELRPELFNGYMMTGLIYTWLLRDYVQAELYFKKALELNPDRTNPANIHWCVALLKTRRYAEAETLGALWMNQPLELFTRGFAINLIEEGMLAGRRYRQAQTYTDWIEQKKPGIYVETRSRMNQGIVQFLHGNYSRAKQLLEECQKIDPTTNLVEFSAKIWLANIAAAENNAAEAERLFLQAFSWEPLPRQEASMALPAKEEGHFYFGSFLLRQGRLPEALTQFQACLETLPRSYWGEYGLAVYQARLGHTSKALDHLEQALDWYFPNSETIMEEPVLEKVRQTKRFKELIKKHFPDRKKD